MSTVLSQVVWTLGYLALVSFPLLVLLGGPLPEGLGFWWDFALALGFAGLGVMAAQFGLIARFRRATAPFGMDIIYFFHRWMAVLGIGILAAHWAVLRVTSPEALAPLLPGRAPWQMTAGRVALLLFLVLVVSSLWRKPLRLEYDRWRALHAALAVAAVALAAAHVAGAGYYSVASGKRVLLGGYAAAWIALGAYVRVWRPWRLLAKPYRVAEMRLERGRSWTLTLQPEGHAGLAFSPGQFAWLTLRASPFRAREHPFSISASAAPGAPLEFTIKELGDFTRTIGQTQVGERAYVDGPYGVFTVDRHPGAPGFAFIAGGVGIAPIMSMLRTLADRAERRPLRLVYANNRWEDVLFREELEDLSRRLDLVVTHVLLKPPRGWTGESGYVTEEVLGRALPEEGRRWVYFLCGPEPMNEAVRRALKARGVPLHRIHFELFEMA